MQSLSAISLFSGCGGLDLGLEAAGFQVKAMVDREPWACETARVNFPRTKVIGPPQQTGDVRDLNGDAILQLAGIRGETIHLVTGGPPCQPFSIAAAQRFLKSDNKYKRQGVKDSHRGTLIFDFFRLVSEINPAMFLLENVPGLMTLDDGRTIENIRQMLQTIGYNSSTPFIVNAADYGVPQRRERLFLIGSKSHRVFTFPNPTHSEELGLDGHPQYRVVAQALFHLDPSLPNHSPRKHDERSVERYRKLSFGQREQLGRVDRLDPRKPSKTVISGGSKGGGRSHLHPYFARTLTVRECARLQSFPDGFVFSGSSARQFTQVGNAVPPLLALAIGNHFRQKYFDLAPVEENKLSRLYSEDLTAEEMCRTLREEAQESAPNLVYLFNDMPNRRKNPPGGPRNGHPNKETTLTQNVANPIY